MPWAQIVTAVTVVALGAGGWIYAWRPERREPPKPGRSWPRDGPQVPLGR